MFRYAAYFSARFLPLRLSAPFWVGVAVVFCASSVSAQPAPRPLEDCTVHVLNQSIHVGPNGGWVLPNVPSNGGLVRARLYCTGPFGTRQGQSDFFEIEANATNAVPDIEIAEPVLGPTRLSLSVPITTLKEVGKTVQVSVIGQYADETTKDISKATDGTNFRTSNPDVASIDADGLIAAQKSGAVIVSVWNEGITSTLKVLVDLGKDSDGDGLPDDYEVSVGLDPNDPVDALVDHDNDNLTSKEEFEAGTDPFSADTDSDGLSDGEELSPGVDGYVTNAVLSDTDGDLIPDNIELMAGTDPTDGLSFDWDASLLSLEVSPNEWLLNFNTLFGEASVQLLVTGVLLDGTGVDLTNYALTNYESSAITILNFGLTKGQVFAGNSGKAKVTARLGNFEASAEITVVVQQPQTLSSLPVNCAGKSVKFGPKYIHLACGQKGYRIVSYSDPSNPVALNLGYGNATYDLARGSKLMWALVEDYVPSGGDEAKVAFNGRGVLGYTIKEDEGRHGVVSLGVPKGEKLAITKTHLVVATDFDITLISLGGETLKVVSTLALVTGQDDHIIDIDAENDRVVVALKIGDKGVLRVIDISVPEAPTVTGELTFEYSSKYLRAIDIRGNEVAIARYSEGLAMVDITDSSQPKLLGQTTQRVFASTDVNIQGELVFVADLMRLNDIPIVKITNPEQPVFVDTFDFSDYRLDHGIAVDSNKSLVAMSSLFGFLYLGQFANLQDFNKIAPLCTVTKPEFGAQVIAGSTTEVTVQATDDVMVDKVSFSVDSTPADEAENPPYSTKITIPNASGSFLSIGAEAIDLGGNIGGCAPIPVTIVDDPLTSVTGTVVDEDGTPLKGASVSILNTQFAALTDDNGTFSIPSVPTITPFKVLASATSGDQVLGGVVGPIVPIPFQAVTDVGAIMLMAGPPFLDMGPVVSQPVLFRIFDTVNEDAPVSESGPIMSQRVRFTAVEAAYPLGAPVAQGPVVSARVSFTSLKGAYKPDCKVLGYQGCCSGTVLMFCEGPQLLSFDCNDNGDPSTGADSPILKCGWMENNSVYDCGGDPKGDPTGLAPIECPAPAPNLAGPVFSAAVLFEVPDDGVPCDINVCANGGTCVVDPVDGFKCTCPEGFTGVTCETQVACNLNGTCEFDSGETCISCPDDCGSCCCKDGGGQFETVDGAPWDTGCGDSFIESCVCAETQFSSCCQLDWSADAGCISAAKDLCFLSCSEGDGNDPF